MIDEITITLRGKTDDVIKVYLDVYDSSLSRKWLAALNELLARQYHLEKNYCFFGFPDGQRDAHYLISQINRSIEAINNAGLGYHIDRTFTVENTISQGPIGYNQPGGFLDHDAMNWLHRYFEDLQGTSGSMSPYYLRADAATRWHIRQLNLLCHEYESLVLSMRKKAYQPEWQRPSQLMCWLNAPRFKLSEEDYELFGIETLNRPLGGVFVGVNKSVGKHHWEVFNDEGRDSRVGELTTSTLISQSEAAGDFDIEWGNNPGEFPWMIQRLSEFRQWLIDNNFNPDDKSLTIGHPQVGQVDLDRSFGTTEYQKIWNLLSQHMDVYTVSTSSQSANYTYRWDDSEFMQQQIDILRAGGNK